MPPPRLFTRRHFLFGAAGAVVATGAFSFLGEAEWFDVTQPAIRLPGLKPGADIRVLHLSDLHASTCVPLPMIERALRLGLETKPDLILLTGDYVTHRFYYLDDYAKLLRILSAQAPTFASMGNHDGGLWNSRVGGFPTTEPISLCLSNAGIRPLINQSETVTVRGQRLRLVGLGDVWSGQFFPGDAFRGIPSNDDIPVIAMSHNPDSKIFMRSYPWNLCLCGHTHGGQIVLPIRGALISAVQDRSCMAGLIQYHGRQIYVTRGVGNLFGLRFNCRPEVTSMRLVAAA